jgi:hypothetical protein
MRSERWRSPARDPYVRRMCCLLAVGSFIGPRVALILAWLFTSEVDQAYANFWVPFVGLILLPWTTLMYALAYAPVIGVTGFWGPVLVVLGLVADLSSYGAGSRARR